MCFMVLSVSNGAYRGMPHARETQALEFVKDDGCYARR